MNHLSRGSNSILGVHSYFDGSRSTE